MAASFFCVSKRLNASPCFAKKIKNFFKKNVMLLDLFSILDVEQKKQKSKQKNAQNPKGEKHSAKKDGKKNKTKISRQLPERKLSSW